MNTKKLRARNKRARRNLALKIQLENPFKRELNAYFNSLRKKIFDYYLKTGQVMPINDFRDDTIALLRRHYKRVGRAFTNEQRLFVSKNLDIFEAEIDNTALFLNIKQDDQKIEDVVAGALAIFVVDQSILRSVEIDETTFENINASLDQANQQLINEGQAVTLTAVGLIAQRIFKRKNQSRINTIAITETQYSAEKSKRIEATAIARNGDIRPTELAESATTISTLTTTQRKEWAAILDQVTRDSHVVADGQIVLANQPFVVQNELLMEPGDPNGSPSNIINCRCSALYF